MIRFDTLRTRVALALMAMAAAGPALDALGIPAPWQLLAGPFAALAWLATPADAGASRVDWAVAAWPWALASGAWAWALAARTPRGAACPAMPDRLP